MSAKRKASIVGGLLLTSVVLASDDVPAPDFLEYLGSWEEADDEWVLFDEQLTAETDSSDDPVEVPADDKELSDEG